MASKIKKVLSSFFAQRLTPEVKELYSATLILDFAVSMIGIFEPVFLFSVFSAHHDLKGALEGITYFYLGTYILYVFLLPLGAKFAKRFGYEHSMALSSVFLVGFYLCFFGLDGNWWLLVSAVVLLALEKTFYWPAYHSDFARFSARREHGRAISNLSVLLSLVYVAGPLIGGLIIKFYSFQVLFIVGMVLIVLSNIPILITKEIFVPSEFSYLEAYKRLFRREHLRSFFAHLGFGEEWLVLALWPVFMFLVVNDFLGLGILASISTAITVLVSLFIGKITDGKDRRAVLRNGAIFYLFSWLFRVLVRGVLGVFLVDSYSRLSKQAISIPATAITYDKAQDASVMKAIVFFEMSLVIGKILAMVAALILLQLFTPGWNAIFILGAVFTLLYLLF